MKSILIFFVLLAISTSSIISCSSNKSQYGKEIESPFKGSKYESNKRFLRAIGKGQSSSEKVADQKASSDAKVDIASQINTTMKSVADDYLRENSNTSAEIVYGKIETLSREVIHTEMGDLRKVDTKTYYNGDKFTVFSAYEVDKNKMLKFMKKRSKALGKDYERLVKNLENQIKKLDH